MYFTSLLWSIVSMFLLGKKSFVEPFEKLTRIKKRAFFFTEESSLFVLFKSIFTSRFVNVNETESGIGDVGAGYRDSVITYKFKDCFAAGDGLGWV